MILTALTRLREKRGRRKLDGRLGGILSAAYTAAMRQERALEWPPFLSDAEDPGTFRTRCQRLGIGRKRPPLSRRIAVAPQDQPMRYKSLLQCKPNAHSYCT